MNFLETIYFASDTVPASPAPFISTFDCMKYIINTVHLVLETVICVVLLQSKGKGSRRKYRMLAATILNSGVSPSARPFQI